MSDPANLGDLSRRAFVARFGHVFEESPWIAEAAFDAGLPADAHTAAGLHRALCAVLRAAPADRQRSLILAHPDLAGRLVRTGALTKASTEEQTGAGLDRLTDAEVAQFTALNAAYREKFAMPFIIAVKGLSKNDILAAFSARMNNDRDIEIAAALAQIERIALLRLQDILP
jgi:OHCU decarboxylase